MVGARTVFMKRGCDQLLARSRLSFDQDGCFSSRDNFDLLKYFAKRAALTHDLAKRLNHLDLFG